MMVSLRWIARSLNIARVERVRRRRRFPRSRLRQGLFVVLLVGLSAALGSGAYGVGREVLQTSDPISLGLVRPGVTAIVGITLFTVTRRAGVRFGRLDLDHLLTTVPAEAVVLGIAGSLFRQYAVLLSLPMLALASGFALGVRTPSSALMIATTVTALLAIVVLASLTLSLANRFLTLRSPRYRRYRPVLVYGPPLILWFGLTGPSASIDHLVGWLGLVPFAWVADLALLGTPGVQTELARSAGALCLLVGGVVVLPPVAVALGERVWGTDEIGSTSLHRSRSLVGSGFAEWVFAGWISRPVLTVARKRWVQETRVPRAVMMIAALVLWVGGGVGVYALGPAETPAVVPFVLAFATAVGVGFGFGEYVLAAEYPSLKMTLTTASGRQVVRGTMLAGLAVGVPLTGLITLAVGVVSPVGGVELLFVAIAGILLCVCSIVVSMALGLQFGYAEFLVLPVKLPLSSVQRVYGRMGKAPFLSIGKGLVIVGLVSLPAALSYVSNVATPIASELGTTLGAIRILALLVTLILAMIVSILAYRWAVSQFDEYTIP